MLYITRELPKIKICSGVNKAGIVCNISRSVAMQSPSAQKAANTLVYNIQLIKEVSSFLNMTTQR